MIRSFSISRWSRDVVESSRYLLLDPSGRLEMRQLSGRLFARRVHRVQRPALQYLTTLGASRARELSPVVPASLPVSLFASEWLNPQYRYDLIAALMEKQALPNSCTYYLLFHASFVS